MVRRIVGIPKKRVVSAAKKKALRAVVLNPKVRDELSRITELAKMGRGVDTLLKETSELGLKIYEVDAAHPEKLGSAELSAYASWAEHRTRWFNHMKEAGGRSMSPAANRSISGAIQKLEKLQRNLYSIMAKRAK